MGVGSLSTFLSEPDMDLKCFYSIRSYYCFYSILKRKSITEKSQQKDKSGLPQKEIFEKRFEITVPSQFYFFTT